MAALQEVNGSQAFRHEPFLYEAKRRVFLKGGGSGMELGTEGEMFRLGNMFGSNALALGTERIIEAYFRTGDGDIYWLTGYESKKSKLISARGSKKNNDLVLTQLDGEVLGKMSLVIGQPFPFFHKDITKYLIIEIVAVRPRDLIGNNVGRKNNIKRDFERLLPRKLKNISIDDLWSL